MRRTVATLGGAALLLTTLSGLLYIAMVITAPDPWPAEGQEPPGFAGAVFRLWALFDVAVERNIPTWYTSALWLLLACSAWLAAAFADRRAGWVLLGGAAAAASLDETTSLHERLDTIARPLLAALGLDLVYGWVVVGVVIAAAVAAALWPLVRSLPARSRALVFGGAAVFLFGAVVLELVSGQVRGSFGKITWHNMLVTHAEEACEMFGVVLAIAGIVHLFSVSRDPGGAGVSVGFRASE